MQLAHESRAGCPSVFCLPPAVPHQAAHLHAGCARIGLSDSAQLPVSHPLVVPVLHWHLLLKLPLWTRRSQPVHCSSLLHSDQLSSENRTSAVFLVPQAPYSIAGPPGSVKYSPRYTAKESNHTSPCSTTCDDCSPAFLCIKTRTRVHQIVL